MPGQPDSAVLLGSGHAELGHVACTAVGARLGIALSAGRFRKGYDHLDPNEDAVLAAGGGDAALLAVADGHHGCDAAEAAIAGVRAAAGDLLRLAADPGHAVRRALELARDAVAAAGSSWRGERSASATAVTVWIAGPDRMAAGGFGDTIALRVRNRRGRALSSPAGFLGAGGGEAAIGRAVRARSGDRVVVCSDGVTNFLPEPWSAHAARVVAGAADPVAAATSVVHAACTGGAGDNVAAAVWFG